MNPDRRLELLNHAIKRFREVSNPFSHEDLVALQVRSDEICDICIDIADIIEDKIEAEKALRQLVELSVTKKKVNGLRSNDNVEKK